MLESLYFVNASNEASQQVLVNSVCRAFCKVLLQIENPK